MKAYLVVLNGDESGKRVDLLPDEVCVIGRDAKADLSLPERKISRQHTRVFWDSSNDEISIEDLDSLNGTFLNTRSVQEKTLLKDNDQIRIGSFLLKLHIKRDEKNAEDSSSVVFDLHSEVYSGAQGGFKSEMRDQNAADRAFHELSSVGEISLSEISQAAEQASEPSEDTGGRLISGKLSELSLPDVLQMLATTRKSGVLMISENKLNSAEAGKEMNTANIFLENGILVYAEYQDQTGEEAFYESLLIEKGYFALFAHQRTDFPKKIDLPLEVLLLDGLRRLDEKRAHENRSQIDVSESDDLEAEPNDSLPGLSQDELKIFQLAWKHKKVKKVIELSSLSKKETLKTLKQLVNQNFLKKIN